MNLFIKHFFFQILNYGQCYRYVVMLCYRWPCSSLDGTVPGVAATAVAPA